MEVQIKGTRHGLVICLPPAEFEDIKANLHHKLEQARDFFRGARFTFRPLAAPIPEHQKRELEQLLSRYGLVPVEAKHPVVERPAMVTPAGLAGAGVVDGEPATLVERGLRSGQDVRSDRGHVVILGDVNPGARVEAAGNVLVMGRCGGTIRAGTSGDNRAVVVALGFASPSLSIGDVPAGELVTPAGGQGLYTARLKNGKVVLES